MKEEKSIQISTVFAYFDAKTNKMVDASPDAVIIPLPNKEILMVEKDSYNLKNCNQYFKVSGIKDFPLYFTNKEKLLAKLASI